MAAMTSVLTRAARPEPAPQPSRPQPSRRSGPQRGLQDVRVVDGRVCCSLDGQPLAIPAVWLRIRSTEPGAIDTSNRQRLYEPTDLEVGLTAVGAHVDGGDLVVSFSDGHRCTIDAATIAVASGIRPDPEALPTPTAWKSADISPTVVDWERLGEPAEMTRAMQAFFHTGFFVVTGTPTVPGSLLDIAGRFGRVSATNFGMLFDVQSKPNPDDLAYTPVALSAHVDQPYRAPAPGLQFLHALVNDAPGGDSTVVDGLAAVETLRASDPEAFRVLSELGVEYRYDIGTDVKVATAPMIELFPDGRLRHLRFSPRLDFPPLVDPDLLDVWFRGRRQLAAHLNDSVNQLEFRLESGDVLVVDNHRVLHGRTAFDPSRGRRHVQGCYIDHDGPETIWRLLTRGVFNPDRSAD